MHDQLAFEWASTTRRNEGTNATPTDVNPTNSASADGELSLLATPNNALDQTANLPWDFHNSFPQPQPEAVAAGVIDDDNLDAGLRSLHREHALQCLSLMADLDALSIASDKGIDPRTGKRPRTDKQRARVAALLKNEPTKLRGELDDAMEAYANAFGDTAALAFRSAIESWHRSGSQVGDAGGTADPLAAVRALSALAAQDAETGADTTATLLVLVNFHRFIDSAEIVQALTQRIQVGKQQRTFILILSPVVQLPTELEKLFTVVEHDLPDRDELHDIATGIAMDSGELPEASCVS